MSDRTRLNGKANGQHHEPQEDESQPQIVETKDGDVVVLTKSDSTDGEEEVSDAPAPKKIDTPEAKAALIAKLKVAHAGQIEQFTAAYTGLNTLLAKTVEQTFVVGKILIQIKKDVGYGNWLLFVEHCLPIERTKAETFIKIAKNDVLSDSRVHGNLPVHLTSLELLTRVPKPELRQLLDEGKINPDMTTEQVREKVAKYIGPSTAPLAAWLNEGLNLLSKNAKLDLYARVSDEVNDKGCQWPKLAQHREDVGKLAAWIKNDIGKVLDALDRKAEATFNTNHKKSLQ